MSGGSRTGHEAEDRLRQGLLVLGLAAACSRTPPPEPDDGPGDAGVAAAAASSRAPRVPAESDAPVPAAAEPPAPTPRRVAIAGGRFVSGTEAGRFSRDPALEPREQSIALGPFAIDSHAYASDSGGPLLGLTRSHAARLCGLRGGRLCTELEWERACKGPDSWPFPEGPEPRPECGRDPGCASGFGVASLGVRREWTRSNVSGKRKTDDGAVVRGAPPGARPDQRRCAHREVLEAIVSAKDVGFRCCYGAVNARRVESAELGTTFTKLTLPVERLARLLDDHPRTRGLSRDLAYFEDAKAVETVLARGRGRSQSQGFLFTSEPLLWRPVAGAEFLVVTGRSGKDEAFVLVYHALGDDRFTLASSFVMEDEPGPVVLAYNGYIRPRLHFSNCWGCPGETGKILYREPDGAVVLQP